MSSTTDTAHEPVPIQQRRWAREALKLAAAAVIFITIGAVLALTLRDDDDTPAVVSPGPTPTPVVAPSPTATAAPASSPTVMAQVASPTAAQAATPTEQPAPSPAATEAVPTPIVMGPPAADLPAAGQITATIPVGVSPLAVAAGHGSIWVQNDIGTAPSPASTQRRMRSWPRSRSRHRSARKFIPTRSCLATASQARPGDRCDLRLGDQARGAGRRPDRSRDEHGRRHHSAGGEGDLDCGRWVVVVGIALRNVERRAHRHGDR